MLKSSSIFKRTNAHFVKKKDVWKKQKLSTFEVWVVWRQKKHFWFVSSFEHVNFAINENIPKKTNNLNYYIPLVIFQTYKNIILRNVHSLGWLLLLWFYPFNKWRIKYSSFTYHIHTIHIFRNFQDPFKDYLFHFFMTRN
jgi:hypothetical protein